MIGWPSSRSVPLPAPKPFLGSNPEFFPASGLEGLLNGSVDAATTEKTQALLDLVRRARAENIGKGTRVYYFIGHAVNHFFPEEASDLVWLLNLLGIDVLVPADQECCGAPFFYAGDIESAREAAAIATDRIAGQRFDWIVTSCASGGRMLKDEFPRLFDLSSDGFFEVGWDPAGEVFFRKKGEPEGARKYMEAGAKYRKHIEGRVLDINEFIAKVLGLEKEETGFDAAFGPGRGEGQAAGEGSAAPAGDAERPGSADRPGERDDEGSSGNPGGEGSLPVVTYHHPCHLNRGQGVGWQPEALLELLPGYRYVRMADADRCCGGGGAFTFTHSKASEKVAARKMDAIAAVRPDIVSTSCPVCRIQLMDMLRRRFALEAEKAGGEARRIAVRTPAELLAGELRKALKGRPEAV
jgi:Fe-S oxidoreductase